MPGAMRCLKSPFRRTLSEGGDPRGSVALFLGRAARGVTGGAVEDRSVVCTEISEVGVAGLQRFILALPSLQERRRRPCAGFCPAAALVDLGIDSRV